MEELQGIDIPLNLHHGTVEGQCVVDNLFQGGCIHILAEESIGNGIGNLLEGLGLDRVEESLRQFLDLFWHIETTILGQSFHHSLMQVGGGRLLVSAIIFHLILFSLVLA